jgi:hypothetical protein
MLYHHTVVIKEWCGVAQVIMCRTTFSGYQSIGYLHISSSTNVIIGETKMIIGETKMIIGETKMIIGETKIIIRKKMFDE